MSSKHNDFYKSYMSKLQTKAKEAVKDAQDEAFAEYFKVADKKIKKIYRSVITDFYQSYIPNFYDEEYRRGSLYNLLETEYNKNELSINFNPSKISYRNGYAESSSSNGVPGGLYDLVFRQGWHGGAMIDGKMRYPVGIQENGLYKPYDGSYDGSRHKAYETYDDIVKFRWGKAHQTRAPLEDFRSRINEYQRTEYQQDYEEIWNKYKSNIKIDM